MSDSTLTPKSANDPSYPNGKNDPPKADPLSRTTILKKQLGKDRAWLLLLATLALPLIGFSTNSVAVVVLVALFLLCWGVGKHLRWLD